MIRHGDYVRDCKEDRRRIIEQLEPLLSGKMRTGEHRYGSAPVDTTQQSIERLKNSLADSDAILIQVQMETW